jgi:hypothetical protein
LIFGLLFGVVPECDGVHSWCLELLYGFPVFRLREYKNKVKFTLEQAMKAQRGSRGIALLFL